MFEPFEVHEYCQRRLFLPINDPSCLLAFATLCVICFVAGAAEVLSKQADPFVPSFSLMKFRTASNQRSRTYRTSCSCSYALWGVCRIPSHPTFHSRFFVGFPNRPRIHGPSIRGYIVYEQFLPRTMELLICRLLLGAIEFSVLVNGDDCRCNRVELCCCCRSGERNTAVTSPKQRHHGIVVFPISMIERTTLFRRNA